MASHPLYSGYAHTPWPCEDGGPQRLQCSPGPDSWPQGVWQVVHKRTQISTMVLLGEPGEVYLLTHSALRAHLGLPTSAWVEQIDAATLKTVRRSPRLPGGPMWPGGFALLANGLIVTVYGRFAHLLNRNLEPVARNKLEVNEPYNSMVVLDNGLVVTKNLSQSTPAHLSVLNPDDLTEACATVLCPEPSVARLSAQGNAVYVVGLRTIFRYVWNESNKQLKRDETWQANLMTQAVGNTFAWDMVISTGEGWLMDNGHHKYLYTMQGAGLSPTANRLLRVNLHKAESVQSIEVSGMRAGSVTNPPLLIPDLHLVLAYDSANSVLKAFRIDGGAIEMVWTKQNFGCSSHMVYWQSTRTVWINDYKRFREHVVALDPLTGQERCRIPTPGRMQGVVFPCPGWDGDLYWVSMDQLARVYCKVP